MIRIFKFLYTIFSKFYFNITYRTLKKSSKSREELRQIWKKNINRIFSEVDNFEKDSGLITLSFGASNPGRYIDCGSFNSSGTLVFEGSYVDYIDVASRQGSSLTGKMNISIRSVSDENTNVRVNARYIWIAGINSPTSNTFNFDTGGSATILVSNPTIGTIPTRTCLPTYYAESSVIDFVKSL